MNQSNTLSLIRKLFLFLMLNSFFIKGQTEKLYIDTVKFTDQQNNLLYIKIKKTDQKGNEIEWLMKDKINSKFINNVKFCFDYDQKKRVIKEIDQNWKTSKWENFSKREFKYTQMGDTIISEFQWKENTWVTLVEYEKEYGSFQEKQPFDARAIEQLEFLISNDQLIDYDENIKYESRFDKDHKVLGCKDKLNTRQKHINDIMKAGYEYLEFKDNANRGSLIFRNCQKNYICTITIWYNDHLSIVLEWFAPSIRKNITSFWSCN